MSSSRSRSICSVIAGQRGVDEREDRAGGDVEQLAQLVRVGRQLEGELHPAPPRRRSGRRGSRAARRRRDPGARGRERPRASPARVRRPRARPGRARWPRPSGRGWRGCCAGSPRRAPGRDAMGWSGSARAAASTSAKTSSGASSSSLAPVRISSATRGRRWSPRTSMTSSLCDACTNTRANRGHFARLHSSAAGTIRHMNPELIELRARHRPRRRPDRRRRHLRHRRRLPPADKQPGHSLRDPRGARGHRRHLGPVPLPGHPLGLRPAHLRLRVQAVDGREGDRRRRRDPRLHPRDRARRTASTGTSASATRSIARRVVAATTRAGPSRSSAPTPARPSS